MLDLAHDLKSKRAGIRNEVLKGQNIVLLFEKPPQEQDALI